MAIMYTTWLSLPIVFYQLIESDTLLVGVMFGLTYIILLVIVMALQTGHIAFITKHNEDGEITDVLGSYMIDRKSTRLNSSHVSISYAVFCLKKKIHK